MKNFLLVYDRQAGRLLEEKTYEFRADAMRARFKYEEKYLNHPHNIEVVVLGAEAREQLLKTHARYFRTLSELVAEWRKQLSDESATARQVFHVPTSVNPRQPVHKNVR